LNDFASDISYIMTSSSSRRAYNKQKKNNKKFLKDHHDIDEMNQSDHNDVIISNDSQDNSDKDCYDDEEKGVVLEYTPRRTNSRNEDVFETTRTFADPTESNIPTMDATEGMPNRNNGDVNDSFIHIRNCVDAQSAQLPQRKEIESINDLDLQEETNSNDVDGGLF
jgi:hypothetical protein